MDIKAVLNACQIENDFLRAELAATKACLAEAHKSIDTACDDGNRNADLGIAWKKRAEIAEDRLAWQKVFNHGVIKTLNDNSMVGTMTDKRIIAEIERRIEAHTKRCSEVEDMRFYTNFRLRSAELSVLLDWIVALPPDDQAAELAAAKVEIKRLREILEFLPDDDAALREKR